MDGVLADIYTQFIKYEFNDIGVSQSLNDLIGKFENEASNMASSPGISEDWAARRRRAAAELGFNFLACNASEFC